MELFGVMLAVLGAVIGVLTAVAFLYRCIRGFESSESQEYLRRIARSIEQIARAEMEKEPVE
jgi:hypothetical protein